MSTYTKVWQKLYDDEYESCIKIFGYNIEDAELAAIEYANCRIGDFSDEYLDDGGDT